MVSYALDLLYYTLVGIIVINEVIAAIILEFVTKAIDNKYKHLWCHVVYLINDLELLQSLYLIAHHLMSIMPIIRSSKQAYAMDE